MNEQYEQNKKQNWSEKKNILFYKKPGFKLKMVEIET